jgi:hypothetical protein
VLCLAIRHDKINKFLYINQHQGEKAIYQQQSDAFVVSSITLSRAMAVPVNRPSRSIFIVSASASVPAAS